MAFTETLPFESDIDQLEIFGSGDEHVRFVEELFDVTITLRGNEIKVTGDESDAPKAAEVLNRFMKYVRSGKVLDKQTVEYIASRVHSGEDGDDDYQDVICRTIRGRRIVSKTHGQKKYINAVRNNDIVFAIGPAGTGKTYLAIAMAVTALKNNEVSRIILTRPAVEAGERLGFLPGDLKDKVDPYLRPIYDALFEIMGMENYERHVARGAIEVAPLAYMRGRTLDSAFIILDEAQNTTPEQMKMFLTRLGFGSKAIITGDVTQIDLPEGKKSGLNVVGNILKNIRGIEFCYLNKSDVVRNSLVQKIINAYEAYESKAEKNNQTKE
ncbi:MAG: PhoH family protein [Eubacteriaceae bacterium]|nr:PhoH family protein [Eubacteriaceae bacterium]